MNPESPGTLLYRIEEHERRIRDVEIEADKIPVLTNEVGHLATGLDILARKVDALNRAILTAALSFAVSAILLSLSIYAVFK